MARYFLWFIILMSTLYAADQVEFYAKNIEQSGTTIEAEGDVLIIYQDAYITADRAS